MAESGVLSNHQSVFYGKGALVESYKNSDVFDGLYEVITDKNKMFPTEGKPVVIRRDLVREAGLEQRVAMIGKITGEGVNDDGTLQDNEQECSTYTQSLYIRQKRQAVKTKGRQDEQASPVKLYPSFKPLLADWQRNIRVTEIIRKLAGATTKTWSNTPTAATSSRVLYGGDATSTATIDSADGLDLTIVSKAVVKAENAYIAGTDGAYVPQISRINFGGSKKFYLLLAHPDAYHALYEDTRVQQMLREAEQYQKDATLIKGGDLHYRGVIVRPCEQLREASTGQFSNWGSGSATTGCINLFLGTGAAAVCESNDPRYVPEQWDYMNKRALAIDVIWGVQKALYNGQDLGTIALKTYYEAL